MFTNTAYEALYQFLGLQLHSKFIEVITSQKVFAGAILLIFGVMFFTTSVHFFSRYMPGVLIHRRSIPLSRYFRIVLCLFLGLACLRVGSITSVKRFDGQSWHQNPYIRGQMQDAQATYRVSLVFDILSRTAEEVAALISRVVDSVFQSQHSELDAPDFFFKAVMYAGSATLDDPDLKKAVQYYTNECFDRVLPLVKSTAQEGKLEGFYSSSAPFDRKLSEIVLERLDHRFYTCLDLKGEVRDGLKAYALRQDKGFGKQLSDTLKIGGPLNEERWANLQVSSSLVNHYLGEHEGYLGVQKGSQLPTTGGRVFQYLNRLFSWDGLLSLGGKEYQGAALAAERAQEFSENLARAPHVAGFIKMIAIAIFPWLLFLVIAGYWRVLVYWWLIYFSVLLWTPIWALLYHIVVGISLSADMMEAFGRLSDGISLYSSGLITSRLYHLFAVYSWLQLLTGTLFTGAILYFLKPALTDTQADSAPEFISDAGQTVSSGAKAAKSVGGLL